MNQDNDDLKRDYVVLVDPESSISLEAFIVEEEPYYVKTLSAEELYRDVAQLVRYKPSGYARKSKRIGLH